MCTPTSCVMACVLPVSYQWLSRKTSLCCGRALGWQRSLCSSAERYLLKNLINPAAPNGCCDALSAQVFLHIEQAVKLRHACMSLEKRTEFFKHVVQSLMEAESVRGTDAAPVTSTATTLEADPHATAFLVSQLQTAGNRAFRAKQHAGTPRYSGRPVSLCLVSQLAFCRAGGLNG